MAQKMLNYAAANVRIYMKHYFSAPYLLLRQPRRSPRLDVPQLKTLVIFYKISLYKSATRFADSFEIIAITRSALFNTECTANRLAAWLRPDA